MEVCKTSSTVWQVQPADVIHWLYDQVALALAQATDGKLLLVSNVADLTPQEVVRRYKVLADIERRFRVLRSENEIAPGPQFSRAHQAAREHLHAGVDPVTGDAPTPEDKRQRHCIGRT